MYYLPIYVNNRRMHIVKMDREIDNQVLFTFLIKASDHYDVFSLPAEQIQLICDNGKNENLQKANFSLTFFEKKDDLTYYRNSDGLPIYDVKISRGGNGTGKEDDEMSQKCFRFYGKAGDVSENGGRPISLKALYHSPRPKEYILQFSYECEDEFGLLSSYVGAIRICEYEKESMLLKASLDFGSEASQIHLSTAKDHKFNMNIRDAFIKMVGKDVNIDYWQGRKDDDKTLYKSIYHVHEHPGKTNFGDLPMNNGQNTFLQSLLPITSSTKELVLLPNLKLMEQLNDLLEPHPIELPVGSFICGQTDLSNSDLHDGILRQILCNFLAVIMNSVTNKSYLHFILLVPNVYRQEKVHKLITGLYDDFYLLKKDKRFYDYKGLEVSIVSESDASFFGVRALADRNLLPRVKGACYLIIDAGKGTTDFSLIAQKGDVLSNYNSLYRSGIPASGHVLTYAFYDALRSYFHGIGQGVFFDNIMRSSVGKETAEILDFVSLLEKFKIDFEKLIEDDESVKAKAESLARSGNSLNDFNIFLRKVLEERKLIPGMKEALEDKISILVGLIKDSIVSYAKKQGVICQNVFLTGRAFMLKPFRETVSNMLIEENVVRKDGIFYSSDLTKSMCTYGALKVGEQSVVNKNSNMLGSPNLIEEFGNDTGNHLDKKGICSLFERLKKSYRDFRGIDKGVGVEMSFNFFYEGLRLRNVRNATFTLCGVETLIGNEQAEDLDVFFIGDGFLWKHGNNSGRIESDGTISGLPEDIRQRLVKESIFPFDLVSFGLNERAQKFSSSSDKARHPASTPTIQLTDDDPDADSADSVPVIDLDR